MRRFLPLMLAVFVMSCGTSEQAPRNLVFFIADGCGPATYTLGREYVQATEGRPLVFDAIETGSVTTDAFEARVTDSASSATAYACGLKTRNGMIGMGPDSVAVTTLLEAAKAAGMRTGLVSTARITHATPAAFGAHVPSRSQEADIAAQLLYQNFEVMLGGGRAYFVPQEAGGSRNDARNLLEEAGAEGIQVVTTSGELAGASTPVLGLFDDTHMDYEVDRDEQPSLAELTVRAMELLAGGEAGYVLMVEAGRIDHAGHANDVGAHLHDFLAYEAAVAAALERSRADGETLVVITSDHETGGLSLGRAGIYDYQPEVVGAMDASFDHVVDTAVEVVESGVRGQALTEALVGLTERYRMGSVEAAARTALSTLALEASRSDNPRSVIGIGFSRFLREHTAIAGGVGWTTSGHTAVNVPLFADGPGAERFKHTLENDELGRRLAAALGLTTGTPISG